MSNFVGQALRGEALTVYGDGLQTRSFCYVADLVDGIMRMMNQDEHNGPINLGNPGEFTMLELAEMVKELVDPTIDIKFLPATPDDPMKRKPDITKAKNLLGWEPQDPPQGGAQTHGAGLPRAHCQRQREEGQLMFGVRRFVSKRH